MNLNNKAPVTARDIPSTCGKRARKIAGTQSLLLPVAVFNLCNKKKEMEQLKTNKTTHIYL